MVANTYQRTSPQRSFRLDTIDHTNRAYAAALFETAGHIDCHAYVENDGRVYLQIQIDPPADGAFPLDWIFHNFGGRVEHGKWLAVGERARLVLSLWRPYVRQQSNVEAVDAAIALYDSAQRRRKARAS